MFYMYIGALQMPMMMLMIVCFFWIVYKQFAWRHCWATLAVCSQPHAYRWICRSVRQQSVAVFNIITFWSRSRINKQLQLLFAKTLTLKLKVYITVTSLSCQAATADKWELCNWKIKCSKIFR